MRPTKFILIFSCLTLMTISFQNCSPMHSQTMSSAVRDLEGNPGDPPALKTKFEMAQEVMNKNCVSCHKAGGAAASARLDYKTEPEFINGGLISPGKSTESKIIQRSIFGGMGALSNMPQGAHSFVRADHDALASWINGLTPIGSGVLKSQFTCSDPKDIGSSTLQLLSKTQFLNTLTDLFGTAIINKVSTELSLLPDTNNGDSSGTAFSKVTNDQVEAYVSVGAALAAQVTDVDANLKAVFGDCALVASPPASCIDNYINGMALKILRRPLTLKEQADARAIVSESGAFRDKARRLLAVHLTSPSFLFRLEIGTQNDDAALFALTPYEVASRISYATSDSMPDAALLAAAAANQLSSVTQVESQVRRLIAGARGKAKIREMFHRWLKITSNTGIALLPANLVSGINMSGLETAMTQELDKYLDYIIWEKNGGYTELLTSKMSFANHAGLAAIYGHAPASSATGSATMAGRRQGLLMRAPLLASGKTRTNLVARGVTFRRQVLCEALPSPTVDIIANRGQSDDLTLEQKLMTTNRDNVDHLTSGAVCMTCHSKINPTGAAFEYLDSLGRVRSTEAVYNGSTYVRDLPVNTVATVPMATPVHVNDAYDLITQVANGSEGPSCLARQAFRAMNQRIESDHDNCALDEMFKKLTAGASIKDAFVASIANQVAASRRK